MERTVEEGTRGWRGTNVVEVTDQTFEEVVVEGSKERPVVVDMWAEWCGPCRQLGPTLEKMAEERGGAFLLAKLDTDANQMTAAAFGVQSIPTVIAFKDGEPVHRVRRGLPRAGGEPVRRLDRADRGGQAGRGGTVGRGGRATSPPPRTATGRCSPTTPTTARRRSGLARILAERGDLDEAEQLMRQHRPDPEAERVAATSRSPLGRHRPRTGRSARRSGSWRPATCRRARGDAAGARRRIDDEARDAMIAVFTAVGDEDPLVQEYRRQLSAALY